MNIGLAGKDNGLSFKRVKNHPILSRSEYDPGCYSSSVFEKKTTNFIWCILQELQFLMIEPVIMI